MCSLARVADLERRTILEEYARGVTAENDAFRMKLRHDQLREQTQDLERAMARAEEGGQMRIAMSKAMEKARIMVDD
jgi:hemerythrin-like domain-containing protein